MSDTQTPTESAVAETAVYVRAAQGLAELDTVKNAAATPDVDQPWAELGLKGDEYATIREIIGRRPTIAELAMYSVMWSEHCSYKSSKVHFALWAENTTDGMREKLLVGIGENAGVVDIGDGWAVTFKVESHNHPSAVEPFQGAATGIGGIVRDITATALVCRTSAVRWCSTTATKAIRSSTPCASVRCGSRTSTSRRRPGPATR